MQCRFQIPHSRWSCYSVLLYFYYFFPFFIFFTFYCGCFVNIYIQFYISLFVRSEYAGVLQNGLPVIKWHEIVEDDIEGDEAPAVLTKLHFYFQQYFTFLSTSIFSFYFSDFSFLFWERILDKLIGSSNMWRPSNRWWSRWMTERLQFRPTTPLGWR